MRHLDLGGPIRLLCIGAHPDDIEIGAGGTVLGLVERGALAGATWLVCSGEGVRADEARAGANAFLGAGVEVDVRLGDARDGYFPSQHAAIKDRFEALKASAPPDLILTHRRDDLHQDHRIVSELTWNTFRDHLILEYEIPKYDADLGAPNVLVEMSGANLDRKVELLLETFRSQASRDWFTGDTFRALARLRGIEAASSTGFAEGFYGRKLVL